MTLFFIILISVITASFISCVSYRLANNQSFCFTRSKCIKCSQELSIKNLIPIFSYLLQKGKCSNCKQNISARYIIIELFFLIGFVTIYFLNNQQLNYYLLFLYLFFSLLSLIAIIDLEHYFIPNILQFLLFFLSLAFLIICQNANLVINVYYAFLYLAFGLFLYFLFYLSANISAIGIDDIKMLFVIGFVLGTSNFILFIFLTGIFGVIFGFFWIFLKKDDTFPFAPALCLAFFISIIVGDKIDIPRLLAKAIY